MSITEATAAGDDYRHVALFFEDYLVAEGYEPAGRQERCVACHRHDLECWAPGPECEACLRRNHAYDLAEERAVFTMLRGTIMTAIQAAAPGGIPDDRHVAMVRAATHEALAAAELVNWVDDRVGDVLDG